MARYSKKAGKKVERAMHERKAGKLKSGRSGKTVKSRKQAIAIGLSEARAEGDKVPFRKKTTRKKTTRKKTTRKKTTRKKATRKKTTRKKTSGRKKSTRKKSTTRRKK